MRSAQSSKNSDWDDSQFGMVLAAFGIGYAIMTLGGGIIEDRWGRASRMAGCGESPGLDLPP